MDNQVEITVDGRQLRVATGTLLWEACKANGIEIPIFCYHTKLGPVGACRTCLVEQEGTPRNAPVTACSTPVRDGMVIRTRSPMVEKAQRGIFEFLLANHPLDCPICDRAGECPLQDQTFAFGPGTSRYIEPKRHHVKPIVLGPTIALDRERCVLCWRCVRFCSDVAEDNSIVLLDRAEHTVVGTFHDEPYVSNFSGNVVELCPVGALTSRKQRFNFRPWELQNRPSVCPHCSMGCNINVSVRKNDEVIRFLSRDNPDVDDSWLCDRGRYNFEFINSPERLKSPMIRREGAFVQTSWDEALAYIAGKLQPLLAESEPGSVAGIASPRLTNEDLFVFQRFMRDVIGTAKVDHFPRSHASLTDRQIEAGRRLNTTLASIRDLQSARTIILLGADPGRREPVMELRIRQAINKFGATLLCLQAEETSLSSKAARVVTYSPPEFAELVRALAAAAAGKSVHAWSDGTDLNALVESYLAGCPIAVLYDDYFGDIEAKGEALEAVATLVDSLAGRKVGTIPMLPDCNSMGARDLRIVPNQSIANPWQPSLAHALLTPNDGTEALFILGADIVRDLPGMAARLQHIPLVVVQELFMTETAQCADVILPVASFAEKAGTFTNTERRVQMLTAALPAPGIARSDWEILVDLSQHFEKPLDYSYPEDVWSDIRRTVEVYGGLRYEDIGPRGVRPQVLQRA